MLAVLSHFLAHFLPFVFNQVWGVGWNILSFQLYTTGGPLDGSTHLETMYGPDCCKFFKLEHSLLTTTSCVDKSNSLGCFPEVSFPKQIASSDVIEDMFAVIFHKVWHIGGECTTARLPSGQFGGATQSQQAWVCLVLSGTGVVWIWFHISHYIIYASSLNSDWWPVSSDESFPTSFNTIPFSRQSYVISVGHGTSSLDFHLSNCLNTFAVQQFSIWRALSNIWIWYRLAVSSSLRASRMCRAASFSIISPVKSWLRSQIIANVLACSRLFNGFMWRTYCLTSSIALIQLNASSDLSPGLLSIIIICGVLCVVVQSSVCWKPKEAGISKVLLLQID